MHAESIVVAGEDFQLLLQVHSVPEEHPIKILPACCADEPLHKRVRNGHRGHSANGLDPQNPQVGLPAVELEQGIVVEAEPKALALTGDRLVEEATQRTVE